MKDNQLLSVSEEPANSFHYKFRRRKMTTQCTSLSLLSLLCIICRLHFTLGFAPTHHHHFKSLASIVSASNSRQHFFASPRSDNERQAPPAPFFLQNLEEQQQQQQEQQRQAENTAWNTGEQPEPDFYMQQQIMEDEYSETSANNGQYQNQQDYYYQESSQAVEEPVQEPPPPTVPNSSPQDNGGISSVDARVLESILADGKLDLNSEEEVKKLLEGPRMVEDFGRAPISSDDGDGSENGKYSSKVISSVSDNKFWNSIRAKGFELIDTVGIIIANRIERDTKTLAAIGIFGLDRIRQDIGRALPAAGRQVKKLLLASNSTYVEKLLDATENTPFALPSERSMTEREMLTTPADEIKAVTGAILEILAGNELPESSSSSAFSSPRRNVRSFAPAGTSKLAERQKRAYQARKKTVLKREREGIDRSFGRTIGSLTDATWELRREMQTGVGREAGYRTKGVRRALAAGATKLLQSGREESRKLISGSRSRYERMIGGSSEATSIANQEIMDVSAVEEAEIMQEVMDETNFEYAEDGLLSPQSFLEEKRRLILTLDSCLSQPGNTWLTKEVVTQATNSGINLDNDMLKEVITTMVTLRDQLQKEVDEAEDRQWMDLTIEYVQTELRRLKEMVDSVSSLAVSAAGENAANLLMTELQGFVLSNNLDEIIDTELERMEQILAERVAARTEEVQAQRRQTMETRSQQVVAEVVDATVDWSQSTRQPRAGNSGYTEVEVLQGGNSDWNSDSSQYYSDQGEYSDQMPRSSVEVVSDSEYSDYEQSFKYAESGSMEEEDVIEEENPATEFVLRVLDALFFVGEKLFLVVLPELITGGANISARYSQAQNRGMGSVGWKSFKNLKAKKNQY